ncbi:hypothetical protein [Massilia rubra]|nr:hypothetical protein [Massilia rubra]
MMRVVCIAWGLALAGCASSVNTAGAPRPAVQRDVEGYAIASCMTYQADAFTKDQGDAWASVIVQRMKGDLDAMVEIAEQVKRENAASGVAVMRDESEPQKGKVLPVLHCVEMIDRPAVRAAIQKAVAALRPSYGQE